MGDDRKARPIVQILEISDPSEYGNRFPYKFIGINIGQSFLYFKQRVLQCNLVPWWAGYRRNFRLLAHSSIIARCYPGRQSPSRPLPLHAYGLDSSLPGTAAGKASSLNHDVRYEAFGAIHTV